MTDESRHGLQIPRPSAGVFVLVAPVVAVGFDVVAAKDAVAGFADDGHGGGGDQDECWGVGVGAADAEVVQAAAVRARLATKVGLTARRIESGLGLPKDRSGQRQKAQRWLL